MRISSEIFPINRLQASFRVCAPETVGPVHKSIWSNWTFRNGIFRTVTISDDFDLFPLQCYITNGKISSLWLSLLVSLYPCLLSNFPPLWLSRSASLILQPPVSSIQKSDANVVPLNSQKDKHARLFFLISISKHVCLTSSYTDKISCHLLTAGGREVPVVTWWAPVLFSLITASKTECMHPLSFSSVTSDIHDGLLLQMSFPEGLIVGAVWVLIVWLLMKQLLIIRSPQVLFSGLKLILDVDQFCTHEVFRCLKCPFHLPPLSYAFSQFSAVGCVMLSFCSVVWVCAEMNLSSIGAF